MKSKRKKDISMDELTKGYEEFIQKKKVVVDGRQIFNDTIKKTVNNKKSGKNHKKDENEDK